MTHPVTHPASHVGPHALAPAALASVAPPPRIWSKAEYVALVTRIAGLLHGGGTLSLNFKTASSGNVRWARNRINTSGDLRANTLTIHRSVHTQGEQSITIGQLDDETVRHAVAYVEQAIALYDREWLEEHLDIPFRPEDYLHPTLWFDSTWTMDGAQRARAAKTVTTPAEQAGMLSAGYLEVTGYGVAVTRPWQQMALYYPVTEAQYSVTVRDPAGTGSGWAGVNWNDWTRIDMATLSAIALDKCLTSRNPVAVEPGRYTTILEPQAVYELTKWLVEKKLLDLAGAIGDRQQQWNPYSGGNGTTKIGQPLLDARLSIRADPMDPELGFLPFDEQDGEPYRPAVWFKDGRLTALSYDRRQAINQGVGSLGLLNSENYRLDMAGTPTTIADMIATTPRGILVTRFYAVEEWDTLSTSVRGYTRDGLWLIEGGKLSKAIKNVRFSESVLAALNRIEQFGPSQRVFCPGKAFVVPALKIKDFNFVGIADAV